MDHLRFTWRGAPTVKKRPRRFHGTRDAEHDRRRIVATVKKRPRRFYGADSQVSSMVTTTTPSATETGYTVSPR